MIYLKKLMRKKKVSFKILITKRNLLNFVKISGDKNKLHLNKKLHYLKNFEKHSRILMANHEYAQ